jgi:hypothetical protein
MKQVSKVLVGLVMAALTTSVATAGGYFWKGADVSEPIVIRYTPSSSTNTATAVWAATTLTISSPDNKSTQVVRFNTTEALSTTLADIAAISNSSNKRCFSAWKWCALDTDTLTNSVLPYTNSLTANKYVKCGKWDTSVDLHYSVVPQTIVGDTVFEPSGGGTIDTITGAPVGTGNVTVKVYEDGTEIWSTDTIISPFYAMPATVNYTGVVTSVTHPELNLDLKPGIPMGQGKTYMVRATRATTATTGGIGVIVK